MGGEGHYVITPVDEGLHHQNSLESVLEREKERERDRERNAYIQREGGREGGRGRNKHTYAHASIYTRTPTCSFLVSCATQNCEDV